MELDTHDTPPTVRHILLASTISLKLVFKSRQVWSAVAGNRDEGLLGCHHQKEYRYGHRTKDYLSLLATIMAYLQCSSHNNLGIIRHIWTPLTGTPHYHSLHCLPTAHRTMLIWLIIQTPQARTPLQT